MTAAPRLSLCNEVIAKRTDGSDRPFEEQCVLAAGLGYDGLEVAPFTLGDDPLALTGAERLGLRKAASAAGIEITGLHWLLITPAGLALTSTDPAVRARTQRVMTGLVDLCADLGGSVLVHGSPQQRALPDDPEGASVARGHAREAFAAAGARASAAGVTYCIEPLARNETNFLTSVAEAADLVRLIGEPGLRTMIDTSAAGQSDIEPVPDLIRRWVPTGLIGHIQINDTNRRGPGQGADDFAAIARAIHDAGYDGSIAVEPFVYRPDGDTTAAFSAGFWRGIWAGVAGGSI